MKVAIVTGAGRGIGRVVAEALAAGGYAVALAARSDEVEKVAASLRTAGAEARAWRVDVADVAAVQSFVDEVASTYGRLDVLVNNAGINRAGFLRNTVQDDVDLMFAVNVRGPLFAMQAAASYLSRQGGRIVNVASWVARSPADGFLAYSATKAALVSLTRGVARELAESGVTVNAVSPGNVWTDIWTSHGDFERAVAEQPITRGVEPDEIAATVLFLCSDAARSITGETVVVASGL